MESGLLSGKYESLHSLKLKLCVPQNDELHKLMGSELLGSEAFIYLSASCVCKPTLAAIEFGTSMVKE